VVNFGDLDSVARLLDGLQCPGSVEPVLLGTLLHEVLVEYQSSAGTPAAEDPPSMGDDVLRLLRSYAEHRADAPGLAEALAFLSAVLLRHPPAPTLQPLNSSASKKLLDSIMAVGFKAEWNAFPTPHPVPCRVMRAGLRLSTGEITPMTVLVNEAGVPPLILTQKGPRTLTGFVFQAMPVQLEDPSAAEPVYQGSSERYAVKKIRKRTERPMAEDPRRELACLMWLKAMAETGEGRGGGLAGAAPPINLPLAVLEDTQNFYLVMPLLEEDFLDAFNRHLISARRGFSEQEAKGMLKDIVTGLAWLHALGVAHHDMSLENVMLNAQGQCVLIDFGQAIKVPVPSSAGAAKFAFQTRWPGSYGKAHYMAPELLNLEATFAQSLGVTSNRSFDPLKADMFALGVIMFILVTGTTPWSFNGSGPNGMFRAVDLLRSPAYISMLTGGGIEGLSHAFAQGQVSEAAVDLVGRLLARDPAARPTASEIQAHPWFSE